MFIPFKTLILHFTGSDWSVVSSPNGSDTQPNDLFSVSCSGASDCWAVGGPGDGGAPQAQTLLEHFGGKVWAVVHSPDVGDAYKELHGVSCSSVGDCWAVGSSSDGSHPDQTLIEHVSDGGATIVNSPNAGAGNNLLEGVTCSRRGGCWSVGWSANSSSTASATLIEQMPASP